MEAKFPYPDLLDRDTETPRMRHVALSRDRYACGLARDPHKPIRYGQPSECECIVCSDLWMTLGPWDVI